MWASEGDFMEDWLCFFPLETSSAFFFSHLEMALTGMQMTPPRAINTPHTKKESKYDPVLL